MIERGVIRPKTFGFFSTSRTISSTVSLIKIERVRLKGNTCSIEIWLQKKACLFTINQFTELSMLHGQLSFCTIIKLWNETMTCNIIIQKRLVKMKI